MSSIHLLCSKAGARPALVISALCLAMAALSGCSRASDAAVAAPPPADPLQVSLRPEMAANFRVQRVEPVELASTQDVVGRIEANERLVTRIGAAVTGRVTDVLVEVGDTVRAGQTLAYVSSPELTTAQLAALRAASSVRLAGSAVERARQLIAADVIGTAELQRREAELTIAQAELRAATDQLRLMGVSADALKQLQRSGTLTPAAAVVAPQGGVVLERKLSQGQVAQPGDALFTVADLRNVWVVGALPEQAAGTVEAGQAVAIEVPTLNHDVIPGKVVHVGDTVQPDTRTVAIRTQVDNPHRALKPQMLATLRITGRTQEVLAVPDAAVVREGDRDHVFVKTGEGQFRLTPVDLGPRADGLRPLRKGLQPGTEYVADGAFHLNNERKRAELE
jgi:cobalt-zinc-cadmium efflux system membrane fusion protein